MRNSGARAGVLYVCSRRDCSIAIERSSEAGTQRFGTSWPTRSMAAGDRMASQSPPSEAKAFWGAK